MKITICKKMCNECGFSKQGNKNSLYKETFDYLRDGCVFPCHLELKKVTGSENRGISKLKEAKLCRGYISFIKKNSDKVTIRKELIEYLQDFIDEIIDGDLENTYNLQELYEAHKNTINVSLKDTTNWQQIN